MHIRTLLVGAVALIASVSESQASELSRVVGKDRCSSSALVTCGSVQVSFSRLSEGGIPVISIARVERVLSSGGVTSAPLAAPQIISTWNGDDGRNWECRPGGEDCRAVEDPTTTTPEPITMTLLATGLVGMGGVSGLRRRLKQRHQGTA